MTTYNNAINTSNPTGVTPASYTNMNATVNAAGLITAASNGSGGGGSAVTNTVTASNSFTVFQAVYLNGTTYTLAEANGVATAEAIGIISAASGTVFTVTTSGYITGLTGLTAGAVYWLSDGTPGLLTTTQPVTAGHVAKPMFVADTTTSGYVINYRGEIIPSALLVTVPQGGSGNTTFTAYAPILAGVTATAAMQSAGTGALQGVATSTTGVGGNYASGGSAAVGTWNYPVGKNYLFNGGFNIAQRWGDPLAGNVIISQAASVTQYTADRWQFKTGASQASTVTIGIKANSPAGLTLTGFNTLSWICLQRNAGQTGTAVMQFCQSLTRDMCAMMQPTALALSFNVKTGAQWSPTSGTVTITIYTGTGTTDSSGINGGFTGSAATTKTFNIAAGSNSFESFVFNGLGTGATQYALQFSWTPVGTAGANDTIAFTGIQLERANTSSTGGGPTAFEFVTQAEEFLRNQYFYRKSFARNTLPAQNIGTGTGEIIFPATVAAALTNRCQTISYPPMRTNAGTITLYSPAATSAQAYDETAAGVCTSTAVVNQSDNGFSITTVGNATSVVGNALGFHYTIDNDLT